MSTTPGGPAGTRPVVVVTEPLSEPALRELGLECDVRRVPGEDRSALVGALAEARGLLVGPATTVDAELLAGALRLEVVARAGADPGGIDVAEATRLGVLVLDAPDSTAVSAAEHAVGLLLAVARGLAPASEGSPAREGIELAGRTVGILGLGRVGSEVALRLSAFGMEVLAHDPDLPAGRAARLGARMVTMPELMRLADVLMVHVPRSPGTVGLVGAVELASAGPGLVVVDLVRGGVVDDDALGAALREGRVAGAGLDADPDDPLAWSGVPGVVATPRVAARTTQAREKAGLAVARSLRRALRGELVPGAVNLDAGELVAGEVAEDVRPGIPLTRRLGRVLSALAGGVPAQVEVLVCGEITEYDVTVLGLAARQGLLRDVAPGRVSYVNAPRLAQEHGSVVRLRCEPESPDHRNLITLRGTRADGSTVSVSGTLVGIARRERLVEVNGYDLDLEPTDHLAFVEYDDRPGVVGVVGRVVGDAGVNIAGMQVARSARGGRALVAMSVDSALAAPTLAEIADAIDAHSALTVTLEDRDTMVNL